LWKSGKTTLIAILLDRLREGGAFGGRTLHPGRAVILSEESKEQWRLRAEKLTFGDYVTWLCRPFRGKPTLEQWLDMIERLAALRRADGLDLLVIDSLATFLPGRDENSAGAMLHAITPLQRLTAEGVSILLPHHPRKHASPAGLAARGSGALPSFVDILIEMERFDPTDGLDRRRRLRAFSRFRETPVHSVIELNEEGTDYLHIGDYVQSEYADGWERLRYMLENAPCKLRCEEIYEDWPADDYPRPSGTTLRRWLDKAAADGRVAREGAGRSKSPFLYWLPGKEAEWIDDPLWFLKNEPLDLKKELDEATRQDRRRLARG
jgi:hypothetical protein